MKNHSPHFPVKLVLFVIAAAISTFNFAQLAGAQANPTPSAARVAPPPSSSTVTTSGGTVGKIPEFHTGTDIENSPIVDSGGNIGITAPLTVQSVNGVLYPAACGASSPPSWCSGSDIGGWINAALSALPTGSLAGPNYGNLGYRIGTIELPNANGTIWSTPVRIGPGTNLIGQGKFSLFTCSVSSGSARITNIVETSGSVVSLTVSAGTFAAGQAAYFSGLTTGTWLNGNTAVLSSVTGTTLTFTDPTGHGSQASLGESGTASLRATISNIVETSGSVVTLTVSPSGIFSQGQDVYLSGLTVGTWLNSQTVFLSSVAGTTVTFSDPTPHGSQGSASETGDATPSVACLTVDHSSQSGPFQHTVNSNSKIENFAIEGNGAAGQSVIKFKDVQGLEVQSVVADGATDLGTACFWLENVNSWTERDTFVDDSSGYNCNIGWRFTAPASHNSFAYNRFLDIKANPVDATPTFPVPQKAFSIEGNSFLANGTYRITVNKGKGGLCPPPTTPCPGATVWYMSGKAEFYENELQFQGEDNGLGVGNFLDITSGSNHFTYWGDIIWSGPGNSIASGAVVIHWLDSAYFTQVGSTLHRSLTVGPGAWQNDQGPGTINVTGGYYVNGAKALVSHGAGAAGSQAIFASDGSVTSSTAGSPGHVTCWKAIGQIGYCSTAIGTDGTCTCN